MTSTAKAGPFAGVELGISPEITGLGGTAAEAKKAAPARQASASQRTRRTMIGSYDHYGAEALCGTCRPCKLGVKNYPPDFRAASSGKTRIWPFIAGEWIAHLKSNGPSLWNVNAYCVSESGGSLR